MSRIRVLVVEDSLTVRRRLVEILSADPSFEVVGEAQDGRQAIDQCEALRPDVVSLDLLLPVLNGLEATQHIMAFCPTPILIVSSSHNRLDLMNGYDALSAGALELFDKPPGDEMNANWERSFLETLRLVSRIRVVRHLRGRFPSAPAEVGCNLRISSATAVPYRLVAIGASTGGPAACRQILSHLTPSFPLPIVLVIHIPVDSGIALVDWLARESAVPVRWATNSRLPEARSCQVFLAPPDRHVILEKGRLVVTSQPEGQPYRPSVDILMESVAREVGPQAIGCLLTGMGKDGAQGLLALRRSGGRTLAQDHETATVFGMPREAIRLGAAEHVLPIQQFARALAELAGAPRSTT